MRPAKGFVVRVFVYSLGLLYLAGDLFVFNGPLNRRIQASRPDSEASVESAKRRGVVARVFGHEIHTRQVEQAARERVWLEGRDFEALTPDRRRIMRLAALNDLIDHQILRVKVLHNSEELKVSGEAVDEAVLKLAARFPNREAMKAELAGVGIDSEKELRLRLGARIQQHRYVESRIAEEIQVGDAEAREWFAEHADEFAVPPRVRARHVFLATLNREPSQAQAVLQRALADLKAGRQQFGELAAALSEDYRTKDTGGDLGWLTEARLAEDFGAPLFAMAAGQPQLLQTRLGWHLIEVLETKPGELRRFDEARDEVIAAIEASKREIMVGRLRKALRAREEVGVHVFPEMITGE